MLHIHRLFPVLLLAACADDPDPNLNGEGNGDNGEAGSCDTVIEQVTPEDGAEAVSVHTTVTATFNEPTDDFTLAIDGVGGSVVLAEDELSATFVPEAALDLDATYEVEATVCEDTWAGTFQTVGAPVDETVADDRTYVLDGNHLTWEEPKVANTMMDDAVWPYLLTRVLDIDENEVLVASAVAEMEADGPEAVPCEDPVLYDPADFTTNPHFFAQAGNVVVDDPVAGQVTIEEFAMEATFSATGGALVDIELTGMLDTRTINPGPWGDHCQAAAMYGDQCEPCPSDDEPDCLFMHAIAIEAPYDPQATVDPDYDPEQDDACDD